ncbi:MAG: MFS transporter [Pseudonocardiales bacterium]|nr:MAG: MFS transporter [Pseudonocardiales bacterium]
MTIRAGNPWVVLSVLLVGFFMTLLDTTIVNIAIPDLATGLGASLDQVLWFVNAYTLVYAAFQLLGGRLGDRIGQRNMFIGGLVLFTLASAACGVAGTPGQLIVMRAVQGLGAAALMPQTLALIGSVFPPQRRGAAFGVWSAVASLAILAGPTVGGVVVGSLGWRWIFFINVPLGAAAVAGAFLVVPNVRSGRRPRLDLPGVLLSTIGLFLVVFGAIEGQHHRWGRVWSFVTIPEVLAAGVLVLGVFLVVQRGRQKRDPLLPFQLLRNRVFSVSIVLASAVMFAGIGMILPLTIYLQSVLGMSALTAGLVLAPPALLSLVLSPIAGNMVQKVGGRALLVPGLALYGGGFALVALMAQPDSSFWVLLPGLISFGVGMGLVFAPINALAMRDVPAPLAGAAAGILSTTRQLGTVIGAAVVGVLLQSRLAAEATVQAGKRADGLPEGVRGAFQQGVARTVSQGLAVGSGQSGGIQAPAGTSDEVRQLFAHAARDVFASGFTSAMKWALLATAVVQLSALVLSLMTPGKPAPSPAQQPAMKSETTDA